MWQGVGYLDGDSMNRRLLVAVLLEKINYLGKTFFNSTVSEIAYHHIENGEHYHINLLMLLKLTTLLNFRLFL